MKLKILLIIYLAVLSQSVTAAWEATTPNRVQVLPNGNISMWNTNLSSGCGSHATPYRIEVNQFSVTPDGVKSMHSQALLAISTSSTLDVSVRDSSCRIDSVTLRGD